MTQTLSSATKRNSAAAVFKDTVSRCRNPLILYFVAMLIFGPGSLLLGSYRSSEGLVLGAPLLILSYLTTGGASCVIPLVVFSYLDNKRALDVFHALPVTRGKLFSGNFLAGLTMLFAPFLLTVLPIAAAIDANRAGRGYSSLNYLDASFRLIVAALFCYALMTFMVLCCSTLLESVGYFGITLVGYYVLIVISTSIVSDMTFGYSSSSSFDTLANFLRGFSPVSLLFNSGIEFARSAIQLLLISVAFFLLSFYRLLHRRSEQVGGGYVWAPVYYITAIGASITVALTIMEAFSDANETIGIPIGILLGFLCYLILDCLRNRGFGNILKSLLVSAVTTVAVTLVLLTVHLTGTFGYENWIPTADQIDSVTVQMDTNISEMSLYDDFTLTDPENIESLLSLHRSILANQSVIEKGSEDDSLRLTDYTPYPFDDADHPAYELGYAWVNLSYTLKDGRTVSRSYHAIPFELTEPVKEILQSEGYLTAIAEKVQQDADYLKGLSEKDLNDLVRADDYVLCLALPSFGSDSYYSETLTLTGDMQNDLLDALAQDIADRPAGSWISPETQPIATLEYSYERDNNERFTWEDYTFNLYETDARVLALLQQYGYYDGEEILPNRSYTLQMSSADAMIVTTDDYDYLKASGDLRVFHFAGTGLGYSMEKYLMEKVDYDNGSGTYRTYLGDTTIPGGSIDVTDRMVNRDFTEEELLTLRSLTLQVAYSEQPMDVLYLDGYTALIPPENLAAVRAILYGE